MGHAVIKRIKHLLDKNQTNGCDQTTSEPSFVEGLSRTLLGLNAATTRNAISSTMAHLISCHNESGFVFSREFSDLLGCDFFVPIHGYANTQKTVFLLCKGFLPLQLSFVYLFCKKCDFFAPIHGYTLQSDHFLFVYLFFYL
jgi:hypothetical protein